MISRSLRRPVSPIVFNCGTGRIRTRDVQAAASELFQPREPAQPSTEPSPTPLKATDPLAVQSFQGLSAPGFSGTSSVHDSFSNFACFNRGLTVTPAAVPQGLPTRNMGTTPPDATPTFLGFSNLIALLVIQDESRLWIMGSPRSPARRHRLRKPLFEPWSRLYRS